MSNAFRKYKKLNFRYLNIKDEDYDDLNRFEQRDLIKKQFENKLHVIFSYKFITEIISYTILGFCIYMVFFTSLNLLYLLIPLSVIFYFISILLNEKYKNNVRYYKMSMSIMNDIIFNEHNVRLPDIQ